MGHHIHALVTPDAVDAAVAARYELPCFPESGFTIIGLHPYHHDYWAEKLGLAPQFYTTHLLDTNVTRFFAQALALNRYALISTEYHGGQGAQYAAVYEAGRCLMPETRGGINVALHRIGVRRGWRHDEFDTLNLGRYRSFDAHFERYYDAD